MHRFSPEFSWPVPLALAESLSKERLQTGDTFYDHAHSYEEIWSEALKSMNCALQVISSMAGEVRVSVLRPNEKRTALIKVEERVFSYEALRIQLGQKTA